MSNSHHRKKKRKHITSKGPALFSDFDKISRDLLTKGYCKDQIISVTTHSDTGVTLTSTAVKHERHSTGGVVAQCKYKNASIDIKIDKKAQISTTLTFSEKLLPSMKTIATLRFPEYRSSKLEVNYFHDYAALAMSFALNLSPAVRLSATVGTPDIAFGIEAKYKTTTFCFTSYNAGISMTKPYCNAAIILANKGDFLRLSYGHHFNQSRKFTAVADITRRFSKNENTITVGGSYIVDHRTMMKANLNNHGKLKMVLQHKSSPKSYLTISGEFDTKNLDKAPRIGLALALML